MDNIGLDLHQRESQLCILTEAGELIEQRIATPRERFSAVLGARPPSRILLEASTESEWVARHLEGLGHAVIIADPGFAPRGAPASLGAPRRGGIGTADLDQEVTDQGRASAMQLMAAGETGIQFWRHPPHRISPRAGEGTRHR